MDILHLENDNPEGINYREIKTLISKAFEKAKSESKKSSRPGWYAYISDNLKNTSPSERTIGRYYKKYIEGKLDEIGQPKEDIIDEMSIWLGYDSFADFCHKNFSGDDLIYEDNNPVNNKEEEKEVIGQSGFSQGWLGQKNYLKGGVAGLGIAAIIGFSSYLGLSGMASSECMYWENTHYEKINCDEEIHPETIIIPYDEQMVKYFYKIEPTDTTTYFRAGKAVVWYIKIDGEVEFYSSSGKHPIIGKQLKPVTPYIVDKYGLPKK